MVTYQICIWMVLLSYPDTNLVSYHDYQVMFFISYLLFNYPDTNLVSYHDYQAMFVISYLLFIYIDTNLVCYHDYQVMFLISYLLFSDQIWKKNNENIDLQTKQVLTRED
jgi:hypothetical protein